MTEIEEIVARIRVLPDCSLLPPAGRPNIEAGHELPDDLARFYTVCGGANLFDSSAYGMRVVSPAEFVSSNQVLLGERYPDDITDSWYIVACAGREASISVDCAPTRLGRCYDSFWEVHGMAGSSRVVGMSFTDFLGRFVANRGDYWYWRGPNAPNYGDAYDGELAK